jgi:hypothetical protein
MKYFCLLCFALTILTTGCKKVQAPASGVTEDAVGLPFYPASAEWGTGSRVIQDSGVTLAASARETSDAPDKVIAFYKKKISDAKIIADSFGDLVHTNITGKTKDGSDAEVLVMKLPQQKTQIFVSVRRHPK